MKFTMMFRDVEDRTHTFKGLLKGKMQSREGLDFGIGGNRNVDGLERNAQVYPWEKESNKKWMEQLKLESEDNIKKHPDPIENPLEEIANEVHSQYRWKK
ncbi:hypothetical protein FQA39_LY12161 [Lamprigera yunnana]|nr:hypothetical protein FQA39_LY12161 [Lamprigera yunnana]